MLPNDLSRLRISEPAFAGLTEVPPQEQEGTYSNDLQVWIHAGRPAALSVVAHLKSNTKVGSED